MEKLVVIVSNEPAGGEVAKKLLNGGDGKASALVCSLSQLPRLTRDSLQPNVLLIDETAVPSAIAMKQLISYSKRSWPKARVLVVGDGNLEQMIAAARGDADGYVPNRSSVDEIVALIARAVCGEEFVLPQEAKRGSPPVCLTPFVRENFLEAGGLTTREREITTLIAEGLTNRELSARLHISIETAKWHVKNALRKLGLRDRTELAIHWHSRMLLPPEYPRESIATCW